MDFSAANAKKLLEGFEFSKLFIDELGWDRHTVELRVEVPSGTFVLRAVAQKRGMVAWICEALNGERIPDRATRRKIEAQVAKTTLEHLVVFTDARACRWPRTSVPDATE